MTTKNQKPLTEREKVEREIATLNESIRFSWLELAESGELHLSPEDQMGIRTHIEMLIESLKEMLQYLDELKRKKA